MLSLRASWSCRLISHSDDRGLSAFNHDFAVTGNYQGLSVSAVQCRTCDDPRHTGDFGCTAA
jgi:hypothetical protein